MTVDLFELWDGNVLVTRALGTATINDWARAQDEVFILRGLAVGLPSDYFAPEHDRVWRINS